MEPLAKRAETLAFEMMSFTGDASSFLNMDETMNLLQASKLLLEYSRTIQQAVEEQDNTRLAVA